MTISLSTSIIYSFAINGRLRKDRLAMSNPKRTIVDRILHLLQTFQMDVTKEHIGRVMLDEFNEECIGVGAVAERFSCTRRLHRIAILVPIF